MVQRIRRVQNERQDGFTLIELLIVIVVLGILAGIVVLGLGTFKHDATQAACKADGKQVQTALDAYLARPGAPANVAVGTGIAADYDILTVAPVGGKALLKSAPATLAAHTWDVDGNVTDTCP